MKIDNAATIEESRRNILDKLIDRELAMQRAVENKLDRTPKVMQSI